MVEFLLVWSSFYSFGHWSNSFDLCRTLHVLDGSLSFICASCIYLYALFWLFLHLILLLCFCFYVCKNPKTHKKWKNQEVWLYMFKHIPHVSLALYFCTNDFVHLWAWLVLFALISLWKKSWHPCVIVVNRSSSLSWMISQ